MVQSPPYSMPILVYFRLLQTLLIVITKLRIDEEENTKHEMSGEETVTSKASSFRRQPAPPSVGERLNEEGNIRYCYKHILQLMWIGIPYK